MTEPSGLYASARREGRQAAGAVTDEQSRRDSRKGYRVSYLARKYGLSLDEAQGLITRIGHDRTKLNQAAENLLRRRP